MTDPDEGDDLDVTAQLDEGDTLENTGVTDPLDRGWSPPERSLESEGEEGESLDERLARELPDVGARDPLDEIADDERARRSGGGAADTDDETGEDLGDVDDTDGELYDDEVGDDRAGRLATEGGTFDDDEELFADDVGVDGAAASAEEAAVHVVRDQA